MTTTTSTMSLATWTAAYNGEGIDGRMEDGRTVNVHYARVLSRGAHAATCPQICGTGWCDCPALAITRDEATALWRESLDVGERQMAAAHAAQAEQRAAMLAAEEREPVEERGAGYCRQCRSYCYGDCQS